MSIQEKTVYVCNGKTFNTREKAEVYNNIHKVELELRDFANKEIMEFCNGHPPTINELASLMFLHSSKLSHILKGLD